MKGFFNVMKAERVLDDLKIFWRNRDQDLSSFINLCQRIQKYRHYLKRADEKVIKSRIYEIALSEEFSDDIRDQGLELMISIDGREKVVLWLQARYYTYEITRKGVTWCLNHLGEPPYTHKRKDFYQKPFPF